MYRYNDENEERKIRLTRNLIMKNPRRQVIGPLVGLTVTLAILLPIFNIILSNVKSWPTEFAIPLVAVTAVILVLILFMYALVIVYLIQLRWRPITVRMDSVSHIVREGYSRRIRWRWWESGKRPLDEYVFLNGGSYGGYCNFTRDAAGDQFYIIYFEQTPHDILDIYRATRYEWSPDTASAS